jgi:hypothetical protein
MSLSGQPEATGRLQRALVAFQRAQGLLLTAHRRLKDLPPEEVNRFWRSSGARLETHMNTTAAEVLVAFKGFSAVGLVASADDRHLVSEAQRHLAEGNG